MIRMSLMLMVTQLLAVDGGSLYLCVSHDGSRYSIHSGPSSCGCHQVESTVGACICPDSHHRDDAPRAPYSAAEVADVCACTHVQLTLSGQPAVTITRQAWGIDVDRLSPMLVGSPTGDLSPQLSSGFHGADWPGRLEVEDFVLAVISTIVLRC